MHFTLMVITKEEPNDEIMSMMLAPFDENLKVLPYVTEDYSAVKKYLYENSGYFGSDEDELRKALDKDDIGTIRYLNLKHDKTGWEDINEKGEVISTNNPNGKWDFWCVFDWNFKFLGIRQVSQLLFIPRPLETDDEITVGQKFPEMNKYYREQLIYDKAFRQGYAEKHYPTLFDYICYRLPMEVLHPDGRWDFYGNTRDIHSSRELCKKYNEILDSYPQDYWLTLVDCHI